MSEPIILADKELGGIPREYQYDGTNLVATDIVRVDGERYRMVDRKAEVGERVIVVDADMPGEEYEEGDVLVAKERYDYGFPMVGVYAHGVDCGLRDREYRVLEPIPVEEETETDDCNEDEDVLTAAKIMDLFTSVSKSLAKSKAESDEQAARIYELERKLEERDRYLENLINLVADRVEENAKNTLTFAEDLENLKHKTEHTQTQSSRVDLTTEFLISDLALITEKLLKLTGGEGR
jgi:hypothetical protein